MKITTLKIGGIWHGYLEGHPEIDERALTEEIARQKVERILDMWVDDEMGQLRRDES
jgi:predicted RNase H-like HicB family nuclease